MSTQKIIISNKEVIISSEDLDYINLKSWHIVKTGKYTPIYYVRNSDKSGKVHKNTMLHRYILERVLDRKLDRKELVDHINGNPFDNRRENLRIVNRFQSAQNTRKQRDNTSGYKGVIRHKDKIRWLAIIQKTDKPIRVGVFTSAMLAAMAYDRAALHYWGDYAKLNFPENKDTYLKTEFDRNLTFRAKSKRKPGTSKYIGVYRSRNGKKFVVQFTKNKIKKTIGTFESEIEAAKAYDLELVKNFGEGSEVNFKSVDKNAEVKEDKLKECIKEQRNKK